MLPLLTVAGAGAVVEDQAKAGDAVEVDARATEGPESKLSQGSMASPDSVASLPRTRRSKVLFMSPVSGEVGLLAVLEEPLAPFWKPPLSAEDNSCSFFFCSRSILLEIVLIKAMNCSNCLRSSSGPRAKLHRTGRASKARKSVSAIVPICLNTLKAAIITAGSLVLMAFSDGMSFSCIVYLSRMEDLVALVCFGGTTPVRSSSGPDSVSAWPPHNTAKASRQRTLMARLLVRLNVDAIGGKTSFFTVLKSRAGSMTGKHFMALSDRE